MEYESVRAGMDGQLMKPSQREAAVRRKVAQMAALIPHEQKLNEILESIDSREKRQRFLNCIRPYLKFKYKEIA